MNRNNKRNKAWLGSVIRGAIGLGSSIFGGIMQKNAQERALAEQRKMQNKQDTLNMAQQLTTGYGDQTYVDEFNKKVAFRLGGNKVDKAKRIRPRKKAEWGAADTDGLISGLSSSLGNIASTAIATSVDTTPAESLPFMANQPKHGIKTPDYLVENSQQIGNILRCGGKRKGRK